MKTEARLLKAEIRRAKAFKRQAEEDHRAFCLSLLRKLEGIAPDRTNEDEIRNEAIADIRRAMAESRLRYLEFKSGRLA